MASIEAIRGHWILAAGFSAFQDVFCGRRRDEGAARCCAALWKMTSFTGGFCISPNNNAAGIEPGQIYRAGSPADEAVARRRYVKTEQKE